MRTLKTEEKNIPKVIRWTQEKNYKKQNKKNPQKTGKDSTAYI